MNSSESRQNNVDPINKNTMRSKIRKFIQVQVSNGTYKPGDRIVETRLARELNVSQAPVREAMLELSVMGLLEERPYSGTYVRKLTAEDIEDIYATRAVIEEHAAQLAAKYITEEQLRLFDPVFQQMEHAMESGDIESYSSADIQFHELIMDIAGSKALKHAWHTLHMGDWSVMTLTATKRSVSELTEMHRVLYNCLAGHEVHGAGAAMYLHIKSFTKDLVNHINEQERKLIKELASNEHIHTSTQ